MTHSDGAIEDACGGSDDRIRIGSEDASSISSATSIGNPGDVLQACPEYSLLAMSFAAKTSLLPLVFVLVQDLVILSFAYPPACNIYYGRPDYRHCRSLIEGATSEGSGIINSDRAHHFFGVSGVERPPEISTLQVRVCSLIRVL